MMKGIEAGSQDDNALFYDWSLVCQDLKNPLMQPLCRVAYPRSIPKLVFLPVAGL